MTVSIGLAASVVTAFASNNSLLAADVPTLILAVHAALEKLSAGPVNPVPTVVVQKPAVPIRKSVTPDFVICLEDGKQFKSMKRHLTRLGMTPEEYRAKWGLPEDYPMVARNYAAQRSALAISIGLGRSRVRGRS